MPGLFNDILVPVDFSINTEFVVRQAIGLACPNGVADKKELRGDETN